MTSGIGPVEESPAEAREAGEVLASGRQLPWGRPRLRAALTVTGLAAALTATLFTAPLDDARQAAFTPWPLSVTELTYTGLREPPDPRTRTFTFRLRALLDAGPPTTLTRLAQPYDGLTMSTSPATPLTLRAGKPRTLTLLVAVRHCTGLPQGVELPFLNVTLRNTRGTQNPSYILGAAYAQDLSASLRTLCM
ncbi:hypothetical protein [Streptomyces longisporus]|uniref:Tat pathway signal sequence domain protein n=1 Tax=Streptomyces longisporus TaxID=1948 RepID=A0ABN3MSG0_STRLO